MYTNRLTCAIETTLYNSISYNIRNKMSYMPYIIELFIMRVGLFLPLDIAKSKVVLYVRYRNYMRVDKSLQIIYSDFHLKKQRPHTMFNFPLI